MDPARSTRGLAVAEIWGNDPIHPRQEVYNLLADSVIMVERGCGSGKAKRKKSNDNGDQDGGPGGPGSKRDKGGGGSGERRENIQRGGNLRGGGQLGGYNRGGHTAANKQRP